MTVADECLGDSAIFRLLGETVSVEEAARAEKHIAQCADCRRLVSAAADGQVSAASAPAPTSDQSSGEAPGATMDPGSILSRGAVLGRYVVLDPIGEGAMGVVYAAFDPELDRRVAIKLWRRATSRDEASARLAREAKAMARLSHPNVVAVHDVGVVDGRIFLAMELVEGATLSAWLRERERTVSEKLAVLRDAGRGLAAAHQAGLVHRDFKPENVLVRRDGSSCVTDFGLARSSVDVGVVASSSAEPGPDALAQLTQTGALAGTPAYMAPEQLDRPGSANAASDQYAFCVTAFEVLFGKRPFAGTTLAALTDAKRAGLASVPAGGSVSSRVRRAIARGLSLDPSLRFPSMNDLLAELGEAVSGRRLRILGGVIAVGVLGATFLAARETRPAPPRMCTGGAQQLAGVWDAARSHDVEAAFGAVPMPYAPDVWSRVQRTLDAYAHDWVAAYTDACEATRVRGEQSEQVLDRRIECLHERLGETKALVDLFAHADATVVRRAIPAVEAIPPARACTAARAMAGAVNTTPEQRTVADAIAPGLAKARATQWVGDFDGAAKLAAAALERAHDGGSPLLVSEALFRFADAKSRTGDVEGGVKSLYESAWAAEAAHDDETAARAWSALPGVVGLVQGHFDEANLLFHQAQAAVARAGNGPELVCGLAGGTLLWKQGKLEEALAQDRLTTTACEAAFGPDHFSNATCLGNIGSEESLLGRYDEALADEQRAAAALERILGGNHPFLALAIGNVAATFEELGRPSDALPLAQRAVAITSRSVGSEHPNMAASQVVLGKALRDLGRVAEARPLFDHALAIDERAGADTLSVAEVLGERGVLANVEKRWADAERDLLRAIRIDAHVDADHYDLVGAYIALGTTYRATGRLPRALEAHERAVAIATKALGLHHGSYAAALVALGETLLAMRRGAEAVPRLAEAVAVLESHPADAGVLVEARDALARARAIASATPG